MISSVFRAGLFDDKVALVTGGGSGIGFRTALELSMLGCCVIISARKKDRLEEAATTINNFLSKLQNPSKGSVFAIEMDIRSTESRTGCVEQIMKKYNKLDYLV